MGLAAITPCGSSHRLRLAAASVALVAVLLIPALQRERFPGILTASLPPTPVWSVSLPAGQYIDKAFPLPDGKLLLYSRMHTQVLMVDTDGQLQQLAQLSGSTTAEAPLDPVFMPGGDFAIPSLKGRVLLYDTCGALLRILELPFSDLYWALAIPAGGSKLALLLAADNKGYLVVCDSSSGASESIELPEIAAFSPLWACANNNIVVYTGQHYWLIKQEPDGLRIAESAEVYGQTYNLCIVPDGSICEFDRQGVVRRFAAGEPVIPCETNASRTDDFVAFSADCVVRLGDDNASVLHFSPHSGAPLTLPGRFAVVQSSTPDRLWLKAQGHELPQTVWGALQDPQLAPTKRTVYRAYGWRDNTELLALDAHGQPWFRLVNAPAGSILVDDSNPRRIRVLRIFHDKGSLACYELPLPY